MECIENLGRCDVDTFRLLSCLLTVLKHPDNA